MLSACAAQTPPLALEVQQAAHVGQNIHLGGAPNFRDVGGLRGIDGKFVQVGRLYRSDQMNLLTASDRETIANMRISRLVDLRMAYEREKEPDWVPPGARYLVLDVLAGREADQDRLRVDIAAGQAEQMMMEINRQFVSHPAALQAYSRLLHLMVEEDGRIVFHCTAGKDRTGWATVILLTILGVSRDDIVANYLASNANLKEKNESFYKSQSSFLTGISWGKIEPALTVRRSYLDASFAEVDRRYGSFDRYVREGLKLDKHAIATLRTKYLTSK